VNRAAATLVVLILLAGSGGPTAGAGAVTVSPALANGLLGFVTVASGDTSCHWPARVVIYTQAQWLTLWIAHVGGQSLNPLSPGCSLPFPARARPAVDFSQHSVAAIFTDYGPARSLAVKRIAREAHGDVVYYSVNAASGTPPTSVNPFLMVRVETLRYVVGFIEEPNVIRPSVIRR
jgi:hypothetical protein